MTSTTTIDCELKTCPLEIHWPKAPQHSFNVFAFNWQSATDNDGMSVKWGNLIHQFNILYLQPISWLKLFFHPPNTIQ